MVQEAVWSDPSTGRGVPTRLEVTVNKQRVAQMPIWRSLESFDPPPEVVDRARQGVKEAIREMRRLRDLKDNVEKGLHEEFPSTVEYTVGGKPGYLYVPGYMELAHFIENLGMFRCKTAEFRASGQIGPDEKAPCCIKAGKDAQVATVILVLGYATDPGGKVVPVDEDVQERLDDGTRIPFEYTYLGYSLNYKQKQAWSNVQVANPPLNSDYHVFKEGPGQYAKIVYAALGKCLWRSLGDAMVRRVIEEVAKRLHLIDDALGRDLGLEEQRRLFFESRGAVQGGGVPQGGRGGAARFLS
jgi:hypothetical protein